VELFSGYMDENTAAEKQNLQHAKTQVEFQK